MGATARITKRSQFGRAGYTQTQGLSGSTTQSGLGQSSRVVFNIKGNDYRLVAAVRYRAGVLAIRFFGTHAEYDKIDAEIV